MDRRAPADGALPRLAAHGDGDTFTAYTRRKHSSAPGCLIRDVASDLMAKVTLQLIDRAHWFVKAARLPAVHIVAILALPILFAGCSMLLALSAPKDVSYALQAGSKRCDVIAVLGRPRKSVVISPPQPAPFLPEGWPSAKVSLCDEYKVSGLVLPPGEAHEYDNPWGLYPILFMFTGGASEVFALPATVGDLTQRSLRRY